MDLLVSPTISQAVQHIDAMGEAIAEVAALHEPSRWSAHGWCKTCGTSFPCPTRLALRGVL